MRIEHRLAKRLVAGSDERDTVAGDSSGVPCEAKSGQRSEEMRVLHLASGDAWGGAERVIAMLLADSRGSRNIESEAVLFNEGRLAETLRGLGVPVHVISEKEHSFPGLIRQVRRLLKNRDIQVIHAHRYKESLAAVLAARSRRLRLVITVHGLQPPGQLTAKDFLLNWVSFFAARLAGARFVGVSEELANRIAARLGRKCVVHIPNPMPAVSALGDGPSLRSRLGWDPDRAVVGFVGRLEHVKGPDCFIDLATRCRGSAGFVLVGGGKLEGELLARVASDGLSDRVALLGETADATAYLREFDVLVLPSRHEGLPLVLLEAAACEVPVVAFDVGGVAEVVDGSSAARLIKPGDVDGLREAVEALLKDREGSRREAARWGNAVRARFDPTRTFAAYAAVYGLRYDGDVRATAQRTG
jgi:glycosyltransferase involved in cell wall biosynthesis